MLGRLDKAYGNSAFYVHLTRDTEAVVESFAKRRGGIMEAYVGMGILMGCREQNAVVIARDYIDTVNSNIEHFLSNKTNKMKFRLENAKDDFVRFSLLTQLQGDLSSALNEFDFKHNAS